MNIVEYLCLDNDDKFRSKTIFTNKSPDEFGAIVTESSIIENLVTEFTDIVLLPVKVLRNPLYEDNNHWIAFCECLQTNGNPYKSNKRYDLMKTLQDNEDDIEIGVTQFFTLLNQQKIPEGFSTDIDLTKNHSCKVDQTLHSQSIIDVIISHLLSVGIVLESIEMSQVIGRWKITLGPKNFLEACDDLFLTRYLIQKVCFNNNIIVSFHPNPISKMPIYSKCHFSISTNRMRDEDGIQSIVEACKKLELKHLELHKQLCIYNSKKFTYGQNSSNNTVKICLGENKGGYLLDTRASSNCNPYDVVEKLLRIITTDYNISSMNHDLETLKERFNYTSSVRFSVKRPTISLNLRPESVVSTAASSVTTETSTPTPTPTQRSIKRDESEPKKKREKTKPATGLLGLANILKLNEDSDDDDNEFNKKDDETKDMTRVEEIIHSLGKMNITNEAIQSTTAPKAKSTAPAASNTMAQEPSIPINSFEPFSGPTAPMQNQYIPQSQPMVAPIMSGPSVPQNSLYTLPSQIA